MPRRAKHVTSRVASAFTQFFQLEIAGAVMLAIAFLTAIVWANSGASASYFQLIESKFGFSLGSFELRKSLLHWVNDGLMAIFFLVVGLEIKREVLVGELSSIKSASLPIAAALGGMLIPAGLFSLCIMGGQGSYGWGVPMATDIAFSLGVLALLGSRIPMAIKVFLTALAIVDDIGATLVIAIFYTKSINMPMLAGAGLTLLALAALGLLKVRWLPAYFLVGLVTWYCVLKSGVHASIAGVLVAAFIPAGKRNPRTSQNLIPEDYMEEMAEGHVLDEGYIVANGEDKAHSSPLERTMHLLHPWQVYGIVPIFALVNAGVRFQGIETSPETQRLQLAILVGLVAGKPIGIMLFAWAAVKAGLAELPYRVTWTQVLGAGVLAGIGFTMALFIADLAYAGAAYLDAVKMAIFVASFVAGALGFAILRITTTERSMPQPTDAYGT